MADLNWLCYLVSLFVIRTFRVWMSSQGLYASFKIFSISESESAI